MNHALQSYTPTAFPLNYDALAGRGGTQDVTGNDVLGSLAFLTIEIGDVGSLLSFEFGRAMATCYAVGPAVDGSPEVRPHRTGWVAWCNPGAGIRYEIESELITPPSSHGSASDLFTTGTFNHVSICWDKTGFSTQAVNKSDPLYSEVKWHTGDLTFEGRYPVLLDLDDIDTAGEYGVMVYYIKASSPFSIFGRFAVEDYATEHELMFNLPTPQAKLVQIRSIGNLVFLYGVDSEGRQLIYYSPPYSVSPKDKALMSASILSGSTAISLAKISLTEKPVDALISIIAGRMSSGVIPVVLDGEITDTDTSILYGEMTLAT